MAEGTRLSLGLRMRTLGRRYGLTARRAVVVVLAVLIVAAAAVGVHGLAESGGMKIERGAAGDQTSVAQGDKSSSAGEGSGEKAGAVDAASKSDVSGPVRRVVHVDGAVAHPGVYVLEEENPRINDAVTHAGGLMPEADTTSVNLAAPIEDGQKVHIPVAGEASQEPAVEAASGAVPVGGSEAGGLVNINTATTAELCGLPGIGEVTAAAIVEERETNGAYASPEDLMRVSGIGEKKFSKLEGLICV